MTKTGKKIKMAISVFCILLSVFFICSLGVISASADANLPYLNVAGQTLIYDGNTTQNTVSGVTLNYDKATKVATITLNGVNADENSNGYSITATMISHLNIVLADGSENLFSISNPNENNIAFISSTCPVTISGNGSLTATVTNTDASYSYGTAYGISTANSQLLICNGASVDLTLDVDCRNGAFGIRAHKTIVSNAELSVKVSNARVASSTCLVEDVTFTEGKISLTSGTNTTQGANVVGKGIATSNQNGTVEYHLEHRWNYHASENKLTAWCDSTTCKDCDYYGEENAITLTMNAEDAVFATENRITQATIMGAPYEIENTWFIPYDNISFIQSDPAWNGFTVSKPIYSTESGLAPCEVGEYTASVTVNGNTVTDSFQITKAALTEDNYTAPVPIDRLVYTGQPQELITAGSVECMIEFNVPSNPYGTMVYSLDGVNYSEDIPTATSAGSYTVYYKVKGDANHSDSEVKTVPAAIEKTNTLPTITFPSAKDAVYGDTLRNIPLIGGSTEYGTFTWKNGDTLPTVENNGYTVVFTPNDLAINNFVGITASEQTVALTVAKRTVTVTADDKTVCVGEAYTPSYTASGFVGDDSFITEPTLLSPSTQIIGKHDVTVSDAAVDGNYTIAYKNGLLTVLDHEYDNACDADCNVCGEARTPAEHYSENADGKCDECGKSFKLSGGAIAGIVIGSVAILGLGGFSIVWFVIKKKKAK